MDICRTIEVKEAKTRGTYISTYTTRQLIFGWHHGVLKLDELKKLNPSQITIRIYFTILRVINNEDEVLYDRPLQFMTPLKLEWHINHQLLTSMQQARNTQLFEAQQRRYSDMWLIRWYVFSASFY